MEKPLVNKKYLMQKYPGKGGWIYVTINEIPKSKSGKSNAIKVKGTVDGYKIKKYTLMPIKNGGLFFPIKAEIRKAIGKGEGDTVKIILYRDDSVLEIPDELTLCLLEEPQAHHNFLKLSASHKKAYIDWIFSSKVMETRAKRIAITIEKLLENKRFYDK